MPLTAIRRNPDALTAHLAAGGPLDGGFARWVGENLAELRALEPGTPVGEDSSSLVHLRRVFMGARIIQGGIVASRLALPALIEAGEWVRGATLPDDFTFTDRATAETERFLNGARQSNDYPVVVKRYIAALANELEGPYGRAFQRLADERPDLLALGWDADELTRLSWAHMRWIINDAMPAEEVALYRQMPLREGTEALLATLRERIGLRLPARVMQRDDWLAALERPRQDARWALFNAIKFFVENAEIATLYCLGSALARLKLGASPDAALRDHIKYGPQEIAAGTRLVTHAARFQSRVGARPNDYRSFTEFLRNVRERTAGASLRRDGAIVWPDADVHERGWCPAQNRYEGRDADASFQDLAGRGHAAAGAWKKYARARFGVEPVYTRPMPAELFGTVTVFATCHEGSPLRPDGELLQRLAEQL